MLDKYLGSNEISSEDYFSLNPIQKAIIQEIKKSFKRITSKINNEEL